METGSEVIERTVAIRDQDQEQCRGRAEEDGELQINQLRYERQQALVVVPSEGRYGVIFTEHNNYVATHGDTRKCGGSVRTYTSTFGIRFAHG